MGALIVTAQMTIDGVIDPVDWWFVAHGEHSERGRSADARPCPWSWCGRRRSSRGSCS